MSKFRLFCLTDFVMDKVFWEELFSSKTPPRYAFAGEEVCPTTQRGHWQMWLYYDNARAFTAKFIKSFGGRHIEACKGSIKDQEKYCEKEGKPAWEMGIKPTPGKASSVDEMKVMIDENKSEVEIINHDFKMWCQYRRPLEYYRSLVEPKRKWVTEVIVLWGASGSGKSRAAFEAGAVAVNYTAGGFVNGYNGEDVVVFDDFDGSVMPRQVFLTLTDRYACNVNVKGGSRNWKPKVIYITSNFHPREWYGDLPEVRRRLTKVKHLTKGCFSNSDTEDFDTGVAKGNTASYFGSLASDYEKSIN